MNHNKLADGGVVISLVCAFKMWHKNTNKSKAAIVWRMYELNVINVNVINVNMVYVRIYVCD